MDSLRRSCLGFAVVAVASCSPTRVDRPQVKHEPLFGCDERWRDSTRLSSNQKAALEELDSSYGVCVETWDAGGTVFRLTVADADSGAGSGATLEEHARAFLENNKVLWRLEQLSGWASLEVSGAGTTGDGEEQCDQLTFQLVRGDLPHGWTPVFNANLRVSMRADGRIREVVGRMTAELATVDTSESSMSDAAQVVRQDFPQAPGLEQLLSPPPVEVVVDDLFLGASEPQAPTLGWMWRDRVPNEPVVIISQATLQVRVPRADIPPPPIAEYQCGNADPTYWTPGASWRTDPALTAAQRARIALLEQQSTEPIYVETWARAGTVYRLDLDVASGLSQSAPLVDHALAFVSANALLWRLPSMGDISVHGSIAQGDCSAVTLQLNANGVPVHNATLTVLLTMTGRIRGVTGRMSGEPFAIETGSLTALQARERIATALDLFESALPMPVAAISDSFFNFDGPHDAQEAWLLNTATNPGGPYGQTTWPTGVVVGAQSGRVEITGPGFDPKDITATPFKCDFVDSTLWAPEVVLDPLTHTPAWVNLHHMQGVHTLGVTDVDRAYHFLERPLVRRLWGTHAPREHLREGTVRTFAGGVREITFREYQAGIPVDGAYVSIVLDARDRVVSAQARFVYFPHVPDIEPVPIENARAGAQAWLVERVCAGDGACEARYGPALNDLNSPGELVLLSPAIYDGWTKEGDAEHLAYRFDMPGGVVFWDARTEEELLYWPSIREASFYYQVWAPDPMPGPCHDCLVSAVDTIIDTAVNAEGFPDGSFVTRPLSDGGIDGDTLRIAGFIEGVDSWFVDTFNYRGPRGDGGIITDFHNYFADEQVYAGGSPAPDNAFWLPLKYDSTSRSYSTAAVLLGRNVTAQDVYAHEFMHGPTHFNVGYANFHEPGALDESMSDIAAVISTPPPDGGWDLGVLTQLYINQGRPLRNVLMPSLVNNDIQHVSEQDRCDTSQSICTHEWMGIPNRAAALIAEGFPDGGGRPFGRLAMADLILAPGLRRRAPAPHASDRFLNQMLVALANCKVLAKLAGDPTATLKGKSTALKPEDCDFIEQAYREVGVEGVRAPVGAYASSSLPAYDEVSLYPGRHTRAGCTIRDHVLTVEVSSVQLSSSSMNSPPWSILWPNDPANWQLRVRKVDAGSDLDPTDRSFVYSVETKWLKLPFLATVDEQFNRPPGVMSDLECVNTPGTVEVELWSTPLIESYASFLNGDDGTPTVNAGVSSPCTVNEVLGVHFHKGENLALTHLPRQGVNDNSHGYWVDRLDGGNPNRLDATMRWFHDGTNGIAARVAYLVEHPLNEADAGFCVVPGTMLAPQRQIP